MKSDKKSIRVRMPRVTEAALRAIAKANGVTMNAVICYALWREVFSEDNRFLPLTEMRGSASDRP